VGHRQPGRPDAQDQDGGAEPEGRRPAELGVEDPASSGPATLVSARSPLLRQLRGVPVVWNWARKPVVRPGAM
jgi:hypothetical protein